MKNILIILTSLLISTQLFAAGDDSSSSSETSLYNDAVSFIKRAGKLEKKDKPDKAKKLYSSAFKKLKDAHMKDKKNPDILNYMGFTSRKTGNFDKAEEYYLKGLSIDPKHNGINEYLGELYVKTGRMELAKERLAVLKNCNCEEYAELKEVIEKK